MARGRQLSQLLNQLKAEAGASLLPASSVQSRDHQIQLLNRVQARLYAAWDWDFAFVKRDVPVTTNDRFLGLPADLEFERISQASVAQGTSSDWRPLGYNITDSDYRQTAENALGSPLKWGIYEDGKFELWPVPDNHYRVRFRGCKLLPLMVDNADRAVLDDTLIVLFAAAEMMKRQKLLDWEDKQREAMLHFTRLRSMTGTNKRQPFVNGGGWSGLTGDMAPPAVPGLDYIV